jgi:hypothetical protein
MDMQHRMRAGSKVAIRPHMLIMHSQKNHPSMERPPAALVLVPALHGLLLMRDSQRLSQRQPHSHQALSHMEHSNTLPTSTTSSSRSSRGSGAQPLLHMHLPQV